MPSNATVTAYYTFVANSKARASEVNANFSLYRGHLIPIEPLTATGSNITYDLGSRDYSWRNTYLKSLQVRCATSTSDFVIQGQTSVTAGAAEFLFGSTTIASMDISNGIYRHSLENAANRMTTTALGTKIFNATITTATFVDVTNLSLTIAIKKSAVQIELLSDYTTTGSVGQINMVSGATTRPQMVFRIIRDTTTSVITDPIYIDTPNTNTSYYFPATSLNWIDNPGAGSYTYKLQVGIPGAGGDTTVTINHVKMRIREL